MKKKSSFAVCIFLVALAACLVFVGAQESMAKKTMISIGGGPAGGAMAMAAGGMADFINKKLPNVDASARGTGASTENFKLLGIKAIDFGMSATDVAYKGINGISPFNKPILNVRALGLIWSSEFIVMVKKNSGITSFKDLKGKKIAGGAAGTGMLNASRSLLPLFGVNLEDVKTLGYRPAAYAFKDGRVDAIAMRGPQPFPPAIELTTTQDVRFLSMTEEEQNLVIEKFPYYSKNILPAGIYRLQDNPVHNVRQDCYLAARDDTPEELVYQVTKTIFSQEGLQYMSKVHRIFKTLKLDRVLDWATTKQIVQMHPGAMSYYKELAKQLGR